MKVLVACEESQATCTAFRLYGHEAYSCDIQETSGNHLEWHIKDDAIKVLNREKWDLVIAHPPCTFLTKCSAHLLFNTDHSIKDNLRYLSGLKAKQFFYEFYNYNGRILIENPTPLTIWKLPKPTQVIDYADFGWEYHKRTCLWIKGLPPIIPTCYGIEAKPFKDFPIKTSKARSKTPIGFSYALAAQYDNFFKYLEKA